MDNPQDKAGNEIATGGNEPYPYPRDAIARLYGGPETRWADVSKECEGFLRRAVRWTATPRQAEARMNAIQLIADTAPRASTRLRAHHLLLEVASGKHVREWIDVEARAAKNQVQTLESLYNLQAVAARIVEARAVPRGTLEEETPQPVTPPADTPPINTDSK